jgi:N-acetyl-anhydromuramyl-L-alanine amidase AmpD
MKVIIHCSATPNGRNDQAEDIHRWHKDRGWDGIGYHYVITVDGKLQNGRPEYWTGSHAKGHNTGSIGICMIGTDEYNLDQWAILDKLLRKLCCKYNDLKIIGHNEISDKECPGFDVQWWLNNKFYEKHSK